MVRADFSPQLLLSTGVQISFFFFFPSLPAVKQSGIYRRPLAELCPLLQTNLPAPSFYPAQIGAGQEGQTLNPRVVVFALEAQICHADQCPHGRVFVCFFGLFFFFLLLTDALFSDALGSWKGTLFSPPPPSLLLVRC